MRPSRRWVAADSPKLLHRVGHLAQPAQKVRDGDAPDGCTQVSTTHCCLCDGKGEQAQGSCAQRAVMKSMASTARRENVSRQLFDSDAGRESCLLQYVQLGMRPGWHRRGRTVPTQVSRMQASAAMSSSGRTRNAWQGIGGQRLFGDDTALIVGSGCFGRHCDG